jgi:hypothetical protein
MVWRNQMFYRTLLVPAACAALAAQDEPRHNLHRYLRGIADSQLAARRAEVEAMRDRQGHERRRTELRAAALRMIGGLDDALSRGEGRV